MALVDQTMLAADATFQGRVRAALVNYVLNTVLAEASNDQQTLTVTGSPTGGSFTLAGGPLTAAVAPAWNDSAQLVQSRLRAALGEGDDCVCTGGPLPGSVVTVVWVGNLAYSPQVKLTLSANNLTGGSSPNVTIGQSAGVAVFRHVERVVAARVVISDLTNLAGKVAILVAADATIQGDYTGGSNNQAAVTDAHITAAVTAAFALFV